MKRVCISTALFLVLTAQACGRTHMDGPFPRQSGVAAGTGGATRNGGMDGGGSSGGAGGHGGSSGPGGYDGATDASGDCPPCLAGAFVGCAPAGGCVSEMHGSGMGNSSTACFDNGVRIQRGAGVDGNTVHFSGSASKNGKTCYLWSRTTGPSESGTITFTDGVGNQLALGEPDVTGATTVDCAGKTYVMSSHCGGWDDSANCDPGNCP